MYECSAYYSLEQTLSLKITDSQNLIVLKVTEENVTSFPIRIYVATIKLFLKVYREF